MFELTDFIHAQLVADEEEGHNNACITHSSSNVRCYLPKKIIYIILNLIQNVDKKTYN